LSQHNHRSVGLDPRLRAPRRVAVGLKPTLQ
jgi:hypothetical protein